MNLLQQGLNQQIKQCIDDSGLKAHFEKDKTEKGQSRLENLQELVGAGKSFEIEVDIDDENISVRSTLFSRTRRWKPAKPRVTHGKTAYS